MNLKWPWNEFPKDDAVWEKYRWQFQKVPHLLVIGSTS